MDDESHRGVERLGDSLFPVNLPLGAISADHEATLPPVLSHISDDVVTVAASSGAGVASGEVKSEHTRHGHRQGTSFSRPAFWPDGWPRFVKCPNMVTAGDGGKVGKTPAGYPEPAELNRARRSTA